jgi:hypothetical protein
MKLAIIFILSAASFCHAQTKWIAHKSHSGSRSSFHRSLKMNPSNFGMAPQRFVRNANLDSVILISEKVAVMVTSETCHYEDFDGRGKSNSNVWRAGRDTVYNHELFNAEKSSKEIRRILKEKYFFANPSEKVVLIGFDQEAARQEIAKLDTSALSNSDINKKNILDKPKKKRSEDELPVRSSPITLFFLSLVSLITRGTFTPF